MNADPDDRRAKGPTLPCGHEVLDANQVHYCSYVSIGALEALGQPFAADPEQIRDPFVEDETLFVTVHQLAEIALGQAARAFRRAQADLAAPLDDPTFAEGVLQTRRGTLFLKASLGAFQPLQTLRHFGLFRDRLAPASGAESLNMRRIELLVALRADTPYVEERGTAYTYREFLDRAPGPGPNDPRTRWWTDELSALAEQPSIWQRCVSKLDERGLTIEDVYQIAHDPDDASPTAGQRPACLALRPLCNTLADFEGIYNGWRKQHVHAATQQIGDLPGTGHTSGAPYLRKVTETLHLFPGLREAAQKERTPEKPMAPSKAW